LLSDLSWDVQREKNWVSKGEQKERQREKNLKRATERGKREAKLCGMAQQARHAVGDGRRMRKILSPRRKALRNLLSSVKERKLLFKWTAGGERARVPGEKGPIACIKRDGDEKNIDRPCKAVP